MPLHNKIIGVFDSGVGGLTVLKELALQLPNHALIYFADTAHCPYGAKKKDEIISLSTSITDFLIAKGCDTIVVACNTATASAIDSLRNSYNIPFVGMEPAVKPAALSTKTKSIGVLATAGTFNGRHYRETTSKYAANINVFYQIGNGLVELVEAGKSNSKEAELLIRGYIEPMLTENIDHLVLGCTHYPFFIPLLKKILPPNIKIVNPAPAVAKQTVRVINDFGKRTKPTEETEDKRDSFYQENFTHFYSTGDAKILKNLVADIEKDYNSLFCKKEFFEVKI